MHNGVLGVNICHWQLHNGKQFRCCRVFLGPGFVGNDMHGADREAIIRTIRQFGIGVFIATFFWGRPMILSPLWVLAFAVLGAVLMASLGVICGLWADKYDQLGAFQSFVLMPLTFLSGVFYSVKSLPPVWETASRFNPFFYMTDGFRYGFFGQSDFNAWVSLTVLAAAAFVAAAIAARLFVIGYKLRK